VISRVLTMAEYVDTADADYLIDKLGDILEQAPDPKGEVGLALAH
jgi:hypothetical protein